MNTHPRNASAPRFPQLPPTAASRTGGKVLLHFLAVAFAVIPTSFAQSPSPASFRGVGRLGQTEHTRSPAISGLSADGSIACGTIVTDPSSGVDLYQAFRWSAGTTTQLPERPGVSNKTVASAISADGTVIAGVSDGIVVRWVNGGAPQILGDLPGGTAKPNLVTISADGTTVVGVTGSTAHPDGEPFRWTQASGMVGLGLLPNAQNAYYQQPSVSADGSVVCASGSVMPAPGRYLSAAWRWTSTGGLAPLPPLPGDDATTIYATGNDGRAVGQSSVTPDSANGVTGRYTYVLWDAAGNVSVLPLPPGVTNVYVSMATPDGSAFVGVGRQPNGDSVLLRWTTAGVDIVGSFDYLSYPNGVPLAAVSNDASVAYGYGKIWDAANGVRDLKAVLLENYGVTAVQRWRLSANSNGGGSPLVRISGNSLIIAGTGYDPNEVSPSEAVGIEGWIAALPVPTGILPNAFNGDMLAKTVTFTPAASFKEHYEDILLTTPNPPAEPGDPPFPPPSPHLAERWSASVNVTASIVGLDPATLTGETPVKLILGDFYFSRKLSDSTDWAPGKAKATFPLRYGQLTVAWNTKTVTFTATSAFTDSAREGSPAFNAGVADWIAFPHYFTTLYSGQLLRLAVGFADRTGARDTIFSASGTNRSVRVPDPAHPGRQEQLRTVDLAGAARYVSPAVSFVAPAANSVVLIPRVLVQVKTSAPRVLLRVNGGPFTAASYGGNFLALAAGANLIEARAIDISGNESIVTRTVTYSQIEGAYYGLVHADNGAGEPAGHFALKTTAKSAFTGKLRVGAIVYAFKGTFAADGSATVQIARKKLTPITLRLQLTVSTGTNTLQGDFALDSAAYTLEAARVLFDAKKNPSRVVGDWTAVLPPDLAALGDASLPRGSGFAACRFASSGAVRMAGKVADGTAFSFAGTLDGNSRLAVFAPLKYRKATGSLAGVLLCDVAAYALTGDFSWQKSAQPGAARFPGAFALHSALRGSYSYPSLFPDAIRAKGGTAQVRAGATVLLEKTVTLNRTALTVTPPATDRLSVKLANALLTGTVILPGQTKPAAIFGIAVRNADDGTVSVHGFCLEATASGDFSITPNP